MNKLLEPIVVASLVAAFILGGGLFCNLNEETLNSYLPAIATLLAAFLGAGFSF